MLTNRKKLKNRRQKIKIILITILFVIFSCGVLSLFIWKVILSKVHYISPLPLVLSSDISSKHDENIENIKEKLTKAQIEFLDVTPSGSSYIISLSDNREIILSSEKNFDSQISSLQFINFRLKMESRQFSRLDLRYDKPIIVFK